MPWNRKQIRVLFALVAFGVLLFVGLQNLGTVWGFVQILIGLLMPFIIGLCIAFILSVPMRAVETICSGRSTKNAGGFGGKSAGRWRPP